MLRSILTVLALAALAVTVTPSSAALAAAPARVDDGWQPVHYEPWDMPAGARCDFAIHGEHPVNEVRVKVLERYSDGSPKREAYTGDLIVRVTNTGTGAVTDADAGGDAVVEYRTDGSMIWYVKGPVLVGMAEGGGNLPRGLYVIDGVYTIEFSTTGYKTVRMTNGTTVHDVCAAID